MFKRFWGCPSSELFLDIEPAGFPSKFMPSGPFLYCQPYHDCFSLRGMKKKQPAFVFSIDVLLCQDFKFQCRRFDGVFVLLWIFVVFSFWFSPVLTPFRGISALIVVHCTGLISSLNVEDDILHSREICHRYK